MKTPTIALALLATLLAGPATADVTDDILAKCLAQLTKTYGLRKDLYETFGVRHVTGERYEVVGNYEEGANARKAYCYFNNGHVTLVELK